MLSSPQIEVIIRTTAHANRKLSLLAAIHSILSQRDIVARPIVVVNGNIYDPRLLDELKARSDIRLSYIAEASTGKALRVGRDMVTAEFFAFLDDDDELIENALCTRWEYLQKDKTLDVVVTTGFIEIQGEKQLHITDITEFQADPLVGIMERCWLSSCGALFRTSSITLEFFDGQTDHQEMTLLAFKIALEEKNILFLDIPTYIVHDTPGSLSKTSIHQESLTDVLEIMRSKRLPARVKMKLERRYRNTLHVLAEKYLHEGNIKKAWLYHLQSMKPPYTLKYLAFTRKVILPHVYAK